MKTGRLLLVSALLIMLVAGVCAVRKVSLPSFGTNDFIQYWSAFQAVQDGANPYDPSTLLAIQQVQGWNRETPQMMWNPPWLLTLLSPVLTGDLLNAARLWTACNVAFALLLCLVLADVYEVKRDLWAVLLLGLTFYPVYSNLQLGQVGLLYGAAAVLLLWSMVRRYDRVGGAALAVLSIKPHLLYLLFIAILWALVRGRHRGMFLWAALFIGALVSGTLIIAPGSLSDWVTAVRGTEHAVHITEWRSATLTQFAADQFDGDARAWLLFITFVPALAAAGLFYLLMKTRKDPDWRKFFPPIAALSLATAPYGWIFDQTVLLAVSVELFSRAQQASSASRRRLLLGLLAAFHVAPHAAAAHIVHHHQFYWFSTLAFLVSLSGRWLGGRRAACDDPK